MFLKRGPIWASTRSTSPRAAGVPDLAYKFISWLISYDVQYQDAIDRVEAPANMKVELTEEQAAGMCYGDAAVSVSSAPNWDLYSEKNDAWILRYNRGDLSIIMRTLLQNAHVFNTWLQNLPAGFGYSWKTAGFVTHLSMGLAHCLQMRMMDAKGCYCIPSFIDIHLHIGSSMVTPATVSRELLRHGVTTCVAEPHEIANVMGH